VKRIIYILKRRIIDFFKFFGFSITKITRDRSNLDRLHKIFLKNLKKPVIFDVGANVGQSVERFKKLNVNSIIHSFEPVKKDFEILKKKFKDDNSIYLNNFALGEKNYKKKFFTNNLTGSSSFSRLTPETRWVKQRSWQHKIDPNKILDESFDCQIMTLDDYCKNKNIENIDILKIDTQGYEDQVLQGAQNLIKNKKINYIELEIIFNKIYEKKLNFFDIEKYLNPFGYELFAIQNPGNLYDDYIFQVDVIYFNPDSLSVNKDYIFEELNNKFKIE
jgi:FkbM family methyltransferase